MAAPYESIRAFLAVDLADDARAKIGGLIRRLQMRVAHTSWTLPENMHLTLRFLGSVDAPVVDTYAAAIQPTIRALNPFGAQIRGVGAFPSPQRPSVIWVRLEPDGPALAEVQSTAEHAARELGLAAETRPFVPHITIGRFRRGAGQTDLTAALKAEREFDAGAFTVGGVSLFSSELTPQGARYTRLHTLTFDGIRGESGL